MNYWNGHKIESSKGTHSLSILIETFGSKVSFLINFMNINLMTSSIVTWKKTSKNGKKWKSQDFMVVLKFWRSENLSNSNTDSVIFSIFSKNYRKVRKLTIWLNKQKMEISTFWYEKFSFFRSECYLSNYAFCYFFLFFVFESHDQEIESGEIFL